MKLRKFFCALWAAALLLSALPAAFAQEAPAFTDMADIQHKEAATALIKLGVMSGKEDGSFEPAGTVSRGECARMMTLILTGGRGVSSPLPARPSFPDIQGHWAEAYIEFCAEKGLAFLQENGNFEPNGNATLFELLQMAEIALGRPPEEFSKAIYWIATVHSNALHRNLFTGLDDFTGKSLEDHPLTRDEAAQVLYNALNATPETLEGSSTGFYEDVKMPDGSPSTLLYERYGFRSWADVTAPSPQEPVPNRPDLKDADQITHPEAVTALIKLGVVRGRDDGAFHPTDTITRAEAARIIALIMNGGKEPEGEVKETPSFSDIGGHWAESCIEYCVDLGILSGRGNGQFDPDGQVTALELCKMALAALGYETAAYQLTGPRWAVRVDELARYIEPSLYENFSGVVVTRPIDRDNAAQLLYNALRATPRIVKPDSQADDGSVQWVFADATRSDGSPSSLLWERFGLDSFEDLSAQSK